MPPLPHCGELFLRYFDRWSDDDDRKQNGFKATRPDMVQADSFIGLSQPDATPFTSEAQQEILSRMDTMFEAVRRDWSACLQGSGNLDLGWIGASDWHYGRKRIAEVIERSDPEDFSNDYLVLCCEFGAALGHVMQSLQPRLVWYLGRPYWESALLDPPTGNLMPVFHWAVKKMSEYGEDDGFAEKVEACLQLLDEKCAL